MCKEEYTQKCYEIRNLQKQLAVVKVSGDASSGNSEAIESVMQELESRREKCRELEEKNAKFEEMNISLEEKVLVAEQMNQELQEEKLSAEDKFESMAKARDDQISELTQQILQLNEELASINETNATKVQQMTNAVQSLHTQLQNKDKEIDTLKKALTPHVNRTPQPQGIYTQHPSTRGQLVVSSPTIPAVQSRPSPAPSTNTKECPVCGVKFPGSLSDVEFQTHVESHFDY